jgi:hypothetical protein
MLSKVWTEILVALAIGTGIAWLCLWLHEHDVRPLKSLTEWVKKMSFVGLCALALWAAPFIQYGSTKGGNGGTNNVPQMVMPPTGLTQMTLPEGALPQQAGVGIQHTGLHPLNNGTTLDLSKLDVITSTNTTRTITAADFERGFVQARIGTNETHNFYPPSGSTIVSDWRAFGAATDWIYVAFTNWAFQVATNDVERLRVYAFGKIEPLIREADNSIATNYWFAPFMASLGVVPQANWNWLAGSDTPSQVWYAVTPWNSLLITWQNAILDRDTDKPLSFQIEFKTDGQFIYRYDLSRLNADTVTNLLAGASFAGSEWTTNSIPTNVTSMAFYPLSEKDAYNQDPDNDGLLTSDELFIYNPDPHRRDTDYDGLTDYEEIFVYKPYGLDVAIDSDDFLIGEMPTWYRAHGWLAFPNTNATVACIHDLQAKGRMVTLVHGVEFPGLTAEWTSVESGVTITNEPPVSAAIYGSFPKSATRSISYTIRHPNQLNKTEATFTQTLRFCPQFADELEPDLGGGGASGGDGNEPDYWGCDCGGNNSCSCCNGEWC